MYMSYKNIFNTWQEVGGLGEAVAVPVAGGRGARPDADALPRAAAPNAGGIADDEEEEEEESDEEEVASHGGNVRSSTIAARSISNRPVAETQPVLRRSSRNLSNV